MEEKNLNTVQTVFSQTAVNCLESIIYDYWSEFDDGKYTDNVMLMLSIYVEHCHKFVYKVKTPREMTEFVSSCIQMNEQLKEIMMKEHPSNWEDTPSGWSLKKSN